MSSKTFAIPTIFNQKTLPSFTKSNNMPIQPDIKLLDNCFTPNSANINICSKVSMIRPL